MQALSLAQLVGQLAELPSQTYWPHEGVPALPLDLGVQLPRLPVRLQASQASPQAVLQQ